MPTDHRAVLAKIKRFDQLVAYLRDEMGWPIARDSFEDEDELFFEFTAEELGIDPTTAAKIEEIKRLRPLVPQQPWGIFFIKFEPKKLPVVALRRILSRVALKKRASANSAERTAWAADDLLFVSNYGEGDERQISFAHFSQDESKDDLPTLKVLGWDNLDTPLHLDDVAEHLTRNLAWPDDESDIDGWRKAWGAAFTLRHREVVTTSRELSIRLAQLARDIRDRISTALAIETEAGPLTKLMKAFQEALVHDLDADGFADMYAQTIAYGLLSARIANPTGDTADHLPLSMPVTNPFLRELMEAFLHVGGRRGTESEGAGIDFDELGVSEVVQLLDDANIEAVVVDFGDRNPLEDPVIHFYELFLKEYDAKKRMQRGVFYTPRPVVSYIVRSVHKLLQTEFGLPDGLADTATWEEIVKRHDGLVLPDGVNLDDRFVTILDPATGTGTFLVEAIEVIHRTLVEKWVNAGHTDEEIRDLWNEYVPAHLLPRLHGYELMMAPYAIAHLKIGLKLHETGYRFESGERARIFLTNALEPAHDFSGQFEFAVPALAHEAQAVNEIKQGLRFTVVVGNPPYSFATANASQDAIALIDPFRRIDGESLRERAPLVLERALQDDYVKFMAFASRVINASACGVVGLITNASYLTTPYLRGMRKALLDEYTRICVLDLGGDAKGDEFDENVFEIRQPVAISIDSKEVGKTPSFWFVALRGSREEKYRALLEHGSAISISEAPLPFPPSFVFKSDGGEAETEYLGWVSIVDLFREKTTGVKTNRDGLVLAWDEPELRRKLELFGDLAVDETTVIEKLGARTNAQWDMTHARHQLGDPINGLFGETDYRPFDTRSIYYDGRLISNPRPLLQNSVWKRENLCLVSARRVRTGVWAHAWVCRGVPMAEIISSADNCHVFPLYEYDRAGSGDALFSSAGERHDNLTPDAGSSAEALFSAIYAILWSGSYRERYGDYLIADFPRVPAAMPAALFERLVELGDRLIRSHTLAMPSTPESSPHFVGDAPALVEVVNFDENCVWLDRQKTTGFRPVPERVWQQHVGSYRVCEKWLKDRKGRTLSDKEIVHYQKIIVAISETIRLMSEIDAVIDEHGGWPGAFVPTAGTVS